MMTLAVVLMIGVAVSIAWAPETGHLRLDDCARTWFYIIAVCALQPRFRFMERVGNWIWVSSGFNRRPSCERG